MKDAVVCFADGSNVLAGASDTGKSYLVHCLDYILGADEMNKQIPGAEPLLAAFCGFENAERKSLTLEQESRRW